MKKLKVRFYEVTYSLLYVSIFFLFLRKNDFIIYVGGAILTQANAPG